MQGNQVGFESSLQQHLDVEQRRAVLEAIGGSINPDSTLGEIIDAAEALGWSEKMGDLSLADLAEALLAPEGRPAGATAEAGHAAAQAAASDEDEGEDDDELDDEDDLDDEGEELDDEEDDEEDEDDEPAPARRKAGKVAVAKETKAAAAAAASKKKAAAKKVTSAVSKRAAAKKAADDEPLRTSKKSSKKVGAKPGKKVPEPAPTRATRAAEKAPAPASKKSAKKVAKRKPLDMDVDDRMSLDQAAEFFLPYVEDLGEATMQALEENTGVSRRKLRFHVGQLVKHGYLERHGMGRGTYYTRC